MTDDNTTQPVAGLQSASNNPVYPVLTGTPTMLFATTFDEVVKSAGEAHAYCDGIDTRASDKEPWILTFSVPKEMEAQMGFDFIRMGLDQLDIHYTKPT